MKEAEFSAALRANNLSCEGKWDIKKGVIDNFISCYLQNDRQSNITDVGQTTKVPRSSSFIRLGFSHLM
jgi:hypothetical protein